MIIGICGQAGSGKSTVADFLVKSHGFVSVAFADPFKRFVQEVFDFSDAQVWGPSEERNKLDRRYIREYIHAPHMLTAGGLEEFSDGNIPQYLTPRHALQQIGSEWGRACYKNVWADYALRVAKKLLEGEPVQVNYATPTDYDGPRKTYTDTAYPGYSAKTGLTPAKLVAPFYRAKGVVIPDVRFLNEVEAILAAGGQVWKLERHGAGLSGSAAKHQSEAEQASLPVGLFRAVIQNDRTLEDLESSVAAAFNLFAVP